MFRGMQPRPIILWCHAVNPNRPISAQRGTPRHDRTTSKESQRRVPRPRAAARHEPPALKS